MEEKFVGKIKKLVDIRSRIDRLVNQVDDASFCKKISSLDLFLHDTEIIVGSLKEFNTFHAYSIMNELNNIFKEIRNKNIRFTEQLHQMTLHLLKVSKQQVELLQNVIENKMIADEGLAQLNDVVEKKGQGFSLVRRSADYNIPSERYQKIESSLNTDLKEGLVVSQPISHNLMVDDEAFMSMRDSYYKLLENKNRMALHEDNSVQDFCEDINSFSKKFQHLNLVPVCFFLEAFSRRVDDYLRETKRAIQVRTFWGDSKFNYLKMSILEKYMTYLAEVIIDYSQVQEVSPYIEIRTSNTNSYLVVEISTNLVVEDFDDAQKSSSDHRFSQLQKLEGSLYANENLVIENSIITRFDICVPLSDGVYETFLFETHNREKLFVLESDIKEFIEVSRSDFEKKDSKFWYTYKDRHVCICDKWLNSQQEAQSTILGIVIENDGDEIIIPMNKLISKEQVFLGKEIKANHTSDTLEIVHYGKEHIAVLNSSKLIEMFRDIDILKVAV